MSFGAGDVAFTTVLSPFLPTNTHTRNLFLPLLPVVCSNTHCTLFLHQSSVRGLTPVKRERDEKLLAAAPGGGLTKLGVNGGLVASAGFSPFLHRQAPVTGAGHRLITSAQPGLTQWQHGHTETCKIHNTPTQRLHQNKRPEPENVARSNPCVLRVHWWHWALWICIESQTIQICMMSTRLWWQVAPSRKQNTSVSKQNCKNNNNNKLLKIVCPVQYAETPTTAAGGLFSCLWGRLTFQIFLVLDASGVDGILFRHRRAVSEERGLVLNGAKRSLIGGCSSLLVSSRTWRLFRSAVLWWLISGPSGGFWVMF